MFSSYRRLWSSTFNIPPLVHHISPLSWTNISVCPSSDQSRHPVGLWELACDATSCIFRPFEPTQTGELCVAVFHWMVCRDIVGRGIYTPVGARAGVGGAGTAGLVSALCFGLHCVVVRATGRWTHGDWVKDKERAQPCCIRVCGVSIHWGEGEGVSTTTASIIGWA